MYDLVSPFVKWRSFLPPVVPAVCIKTNEVVGSYLLLSVDIVYFLDLWRTFLVPWPSSVFVAFMPKELGTSRYHYNSHWPHTDIYESSVNLKIQLLRCACLISSLLWLMAGGLDGASAVCRRHVEREWSAGSLVCDSQGFSVHSAEWSSPWGPGHEVLESPTRETVSHPRMVSLLDQTFQLPSPGTTSLRLGRPVGDPLCFCGLVNITVTWMGDTMLPQVPTFLWGSSVRTKGNVYYRQWRFRKDFQF